MNKILLGFFFFFVFVVVGEIGYLYYINQITPGYSSLSSVTKKKDYDAWLKKTWEITLSRTVEPNDNTRLMVNQTEGQLKHLVIEPDAVRTTVETAKGPVDFAFSSKGFQAYRKPPDTKEVLEPISTKDLKEGDRVIVHESFMVVGEEIKNTNNGIVKVEE